MRTPKPLNVWYGISKLGKVKTRPAIEVFYSNTNEDMDRQLRLISKAIHVVYERKQTEAEANDAKGVNRVLTSFTLFVDDKDKRFKGSLSKALQFNSDCEAKHVGVKEREKIKQALEVQFKRLFPLYKDPAQSVLF